MSNQCDICLDASDDKPKISDGPAYPVGVDPETGLAEYQIIPVILRCEDGCN